MRTAVRQGGAPPFRLRRARARAASAGRMCECTCIPRMVGWRIAPRAKTVNSRTRMFHLLSVLRHRRTRIALTAAVASLSLAALPAGAHAALVQGQPQNVQGGYFDDHSIGGDNHLGWSFSGSQAEPLALTFGTTLTNTGPNQFRVCGYNPTGGWMGAYEVVAPSCPGTAAGAGAQDGWFRYVTANHSNPNATPQGSAFNRWHLMDLQRFALVPLPTSLGGPAGAYTAWDTTWGTCLSDSDPSMDCTQDPGAATLSTSIPAGSAKTTQELNPAPDAERIAIPADARGAFPDGAYQIVAISNPYGQYGGGPSYSCTTISLSGVEGYNPQVTQVGGVPSTCYVPATVLAGLTGPAGRDPMAGATASTCTLSVTPASGHCWATVPMVPTDPVPPHPLAQSNVNAAGFPTITATNTVPVAYGPQVVTAPPASGAKNPPAGASGQPRTVRRLTTTNSKTYTTIALRKQFGKGLSRLRISCRVRTSTASTCSVSWRKSGASYKGNVWLRYKTVRSRLRWQYRLEVKKTKSGHTQTVTRSYKTGGTF